VTKAWLLGLFGLPMAVGVWAGDTVALYVGIAGEAHHAPFVAAPMAEPGPAPVSVLETRRIVPSEGLPPEVAPLAANNNLDVVRHSDGRVYLAFRSAPDHFAGSETQILVVSSADEREWRFEARFSEGTDLREPRLLSLGGKLFLYVSKLGKNRYDFEPQGVWLSERVVEASGVHWGALERLDLSGYIVWRTRNEQGRGWMSAYRGGENIYRFNGEPLAVGLFVSDDGRHWSPLDAAHSSVYEGGVSETAYEFMSDGTLVAVGRNEAGDRFGFGSVICQAPPDAPARWSCHGDPRKFDSPLMFSEGGEIYLVARRNQTEDGAYDRALASAFFSSASWLRSVKNQLDYIVTAKRCSLFRYVPAEGRMAFVLDLPSRGDTCFPGILRGETPGEVVLYNYSSDIDGPDVAWSVGQRRPTYIYRHRLRFGGTG
jgi:hypothetical protein